MKNLFIALLTIGAFFSSDAQIKTPAPSPKATVMQTVGLTDVTVEYSRPSMKGRTIFGADGLLPYGEMWRTGANSATKVTFSEDVMVADAKLDKGSYAIITVPGEKSWKVNFYAYEGGSWGSYKEKEPTTTIMVTPTKANMNTETLTISFDNLTDEGAVMNIKWAKTIVPVQLTVHTKKQAMASIDKVLAGPSKGEYYSIASYYQSTGTNLDKALEYINLATAGDDKKFWQVRRKALILADLGKKKEAIKAATLSMELAKAADNMDYVRMNEKSIAEWSK